MTALELADTLEQQFPIGTAQHFLDGEAAAMLRRQHEAIQKLREALDHYVMQDSIAQGYGSGIGGSAMSTAEQALKDTEGL